MIRNFLSLGLAAAGALALTGLTAGTVHAATVNTNANVIFIVDESGSMAGEQAFLKDTVVDALDSGLAAEGVTNRSYGVVGFGGIPAEPRDAGSGLMNTTDTKTAIDSLATSGGFEDGYAAINFALGYSFTAGAAVNFILVTDEDRDVTTGSTLNFGNIQQALSSRNILLNAIVNNAFSSDSGTALGIDDDGNGYVEDGSGGFTAVANGIAGFGSGTTTQDYVNLALATGGAAWDLNQLRAGGDTASSFAKAFIDIKVGEIATQEPVSNPIPLPAAAWLLLTGIGSVAALRRRKKAA